MKCICVENVARLFDVPSDLVAGPDGSCPPNCLIAWAVDQSPREPPDPFHSQPDQPSPQIRPQPGSRATKTGE